MTTPIDKLPPHAFESEQCVLGCVLLDPSSCIDECVVQLKSAVDAFYDLRHQTIFWAMLKMHDAGKPIDQITLSQYLKDEGELDEAGGLAYLSELQNVVPSTAQLPVYIGEVMDKFLVRKLLQVCTTTSARALEYSGGVEDLLGEAERDVLGVRNLRGHTSSIGIKEVVKQALTSIEEMWERAGAISGISTGLVDLDRATDGLHPGDMIVIAGYPGSGKTTLAVNIAEHVSVECKLPVGIFSMEMKSAALARRMIFSRSQVDSRSVRNRTLSQQEFNKMHMTSIALSKSPIHIDESSDMSVQELRAKARRMAQQHKVKLIIVDYLQLLNASGGGRKVESRQQEVTDISRGIKAMAGELSIPVIALSQLNDDGKLRESRAIGQDADGVWILKIDDEAANTADTAAVNLDIIKSRNGPVGGVNLVFRKSITRFQNAAKVSDTDV